MTSHDGKMTGRPARAALSPIGRRRSLWLALALAGVSVFALLKPYSVHLVDVSSLQAVIFIAVGLVTAVVAVIRFRPGILILGVLFTVAAVVRLVTDGHGPTALVGGVSTGVYLLGIGMALIAVFVAENGSQRRATI